MEENNQPQVSIPTQNPQDNSKDVSFPVTKTNKKKFPVYFIIVIVVLIILGAVAYFIFTKPKTEDVTEEFTIEPTLSQETPTPLQSSVVDRQGVKIEVLNGSDVTGAAGKLKTTIEDLGYSDVKTGNTKSTDPSETVVTFSSGLSQEIKDEILSHLEDSYESVSEGSGNLGSFDIQIIVGYVKGYSPSPTEKAKIPTSTIKPTTSASPTLSITASPTPTI